MQEDCFFQMFMPGATGFIGYNININVNIGLVSGVEARYHSVSYNDPQDNALFDNKVQNSPPGRSIRLPLPTTINLRLCADFLGDDRARILCQALMTEKFEAKLRNRQGAVEEIEQNVADEAFKELKTKCEGFLKRIGTRSPVRYVSIDEEGAILSK